MAYNVSNEYNEVIYSEDAKHKLKLLFNGVEYTDSNIKTEYVKVKSNILSSGEERFSLDNFVSKEAEIVIHDIDLEDIVAPISISIGTLVDEDNDTYEYVPIGIFNIDETPTTDNGVTTIKLKDNAVKFDFPYDGSGVIEEHDGEATMLQILQDICEKAGVDLETTDFINKDTKVSVWDNSINARVYVMYISEKAGCIATINRDGKLQLINLQKGNLLETTINTNSKLENVYEIDKTKELKGNTYQQTYTGKNLMGIQVATSTNLGLTYKLENGKLSLNGTTSGSGWIYNNTANTIRLSPGTYRISMQISSGSFTANSNDTAIYLRKKSDNANILNATKSNNYTSTPKFDLSSYDEIYLAIYTNGSGFKFNNLELEIQIESEGQAATSWEPYVGGTASPNPSYPQTIQNVTGLQKVNVCGKNLLNNALFTTGSATLVSYDDNKVVVNYTSVYTSKTQYIDITTGYYTFSVGNISNSTARVEVYKYKNGSVVGYVKLVNANETYTIDNTDNSADQIRITLSNQNLSGTNEITFNNLMLEKGNQSTSFEPYRVNTYEVNLGKNLFDKDNASVINSYFNTSTTTITYLANGGTIYIPCEPNTKYTISKTTSARFFFGYTTEKPANGVSVSGVLGGTDLITPLTITTGSNAKYLAAFIYHPSYDTKTLQQILDTVQIEKGSTATTYTSYFTPIELNKIGDYQDYIRKSTGKNLFDKDNVENNYRLDSNGNAISSNGFSLSDYIEVKPNTTYTISRTNISNYYNNISEYSNDKTHLLRSYTTAKTFTITTQSTTKYIRISDATSNLNIMQFEQGNTATDLEPYGVGKWYKYSAIGKVVLDGTENGWNKISGVAYNSYYVENLIKAYRTNDTAPYLSNYFSAITNNQRYVNNSFFINVNSRIIISYDDITTLANFKTWLSTHNTEVCYVLATPTYTTITNTTLIEQLESIRLLKGTNNITITSEDLTPTIDVSYYEEKQPIELNPLLMESYKEGEKLQISRVVYEDAIRKFEYGNEDNGTLYINSSNPYITDTTEIEKIYNSIDGFNIYSMNISKMIGNPALDPWDLIGFTWNNKTYKTLAQNTLTFNGKITQSFDTQIGTNAKTQENVTLNNEESKYKRVFTRINQLEGTVELNTSQISQVQTDLQENHYSKEQVEQLVLESNTGLTNKLINSGGNNIFRNTGLWFEDTSNIEYLYPSNTLYPSDELYMLAEPYFEYWQGKVVRMAEDKAANLNALLLQNTTLSQKQQVRNGSYTISFKYKKLIQLSTASVTINGETIELTKNEGEFVKTIDVTSQYINISFLCDTDNGVEIYDLMGNVGEEKSEYSQHQNETTTDTVNISKGITITSSDTNTTFKANSDGIRVYNSRNLETPMTEFTDTGTDTKKIIVENEANIVEVLFKKVGNNTWLTKL